MLAILLVLSTSELSLAQVCKPRIADTIKANVYADNSFTLYINGELIAVDSIKFVPHNIVR